MFGRKKDIGLHRDEKSHAGAGGGKKPEAAGGPAPTVPRLAQPRFHPDIPNIRSDIGRPSAPEMPGGDSNRLTVGKDISLSGDITACDKLVVEGAIEGNLHRARELQILRPGRFAGTAEVEEADIAGEFIGTLRVSGRLSVRASGRIEGEISYGSLKVEEGGQIAGALALGGETAAASERERLRPVENGAAE